VHWEEFMQRERDDKMSNGLLTRALMNDEPLPWRRVEVDVDTDVNPTWLAATARYVRRLRGTAILTLYAYTTPDYTYVLDLLRGGTQYTEPDRAFPADLSQDRSGVARAGVWALWAAEAKADAKTRGAARTLESTLPQDIAARVRAHLAAKGALYTQRARQKTYKIFTAKKRGKKRKGPSRKKKCRYYGRGTRRAWYAPRRTQTTAAAIGKGRCSYATGAKRARTASACRRVPSYRCPVNGCARAAAKAATRWRSRSGITAGWRVSRAPRSSYTTTSRT